MAMQGCGLLEPEQTQSAGPYPSYWRCTRIPLRARERSDIHIHVILRDARDVFAACGFTYWRDIKDIKVENYLLSLREGPKRLSYRRSNAISDCLPVLLQLVVGHRQWARESPLRGVKKLNAKEDPRHTRRAISVEELRLLLATTATEPERFGMTGWERCLVYWLAALTGLRAGEIRRLRVGDFDLSGETVTIWQRRRRRTNRPTAAVKHKVLRGGSCLFRQPGTGGYCLRRLLQVLDRQDVGHASSGPFGGRPALQGCPR